MLKQTQSDPISERCAAALLKAVSSFPKLLAELDPEEAARIVADLIKVQLNLPDAPEDPAAALEEIIRRAAESFGEEDDD